MDATAMASECAQMAPKDEVPRFGATRTKWNWVNEMRELRHDELTR